MAPATLSVQGIYRYPVKSMLGESLESGTVDAAGLLGDRAYALVDAADGTIASAKIPRKWAGLLDFRATFSADPVPGEPPPPVQIRFPDGSMLRSDDPGIDTALSSVLGREVHLAAEAPRDSSFEELWPEIDGLAPREFIEQTTTSREETGEPVSKIPVAALAPPGSFVDLAVLHVLTTATLARLAELAPEGDFDVRRYRPNVLLETGGAGFAEDEWVGRRLALGADLRARVSMATMRCVMTTLAQGELPADVATLRAIAKHHRVDIPSIGTWACAGVYADVAAPGTVHVGDPVEVVASE